MAEISDQNIDKLLDKAKKIHGYTKSTNVNEAANAAARLTEFLLKYNLDISQVEGHETNKEEPLGRKDVNYFYENVINWQNTLAWIIAKANLCTTVRSGTHIVWLGKLSNIQVAEFIFDTAVADILDMAKNMWSIILQARADPRFADKLNQELKTIHGKEWKNTFYVGAVDGIRDRLDAEVNALRQDTNMNALIVYNDRAIQEYTKTQFPRLTQRSFHYRENSGYGAGHRFGSEYQFKTGVGAGGSESTRQLNKG